MIGELAALGAALSWAVAPLMYRKALANTSPVSANIVRCTTNAAALAALLFAVVGTGALTSLPLWVVAITMVSGAIGLGIGDTLYMSSLKRLGVSIAVPLASAYPLFGLVWGVFLLGQPLSVWVAAGAAVILVGIWLLSRHSWLETASIKGRALMLGIVFALLTAVIWSVSLTLMDLAVSGASAGLGSNYAIVTVRIVSVALFLSAASPLIDKPRGFLRVSRRNIALLCAGGLIANGLGWMLMNIGFMNIPSTRAIPISSTSPLFAAFAGYLLFREKATVWSVMGAATVVAGIVLIFVA